jgi:2-(1,2-epoxy-1,2-dihydrophenyl)acetyl-CoA isomerase
MAVIQHRRMGSVAIVELARPERLNALDREGVRELHGLLTTLSGDPEVRAVLLTGRGRGFCAGADVAADLGTSPPDPDVIEQHMRTVLAPLVSALRGMPKPVLAAVNGPAVGLGCGLALACDVVLAAESAYLLLAFASLGLALDAGCSATVPTRAGLGRALTMAMLGERIPAATALAWGLADRVVPDAELETAAIDLATRLAAGPTRAYAATKALLNCSLLAGLDEQLQREADEQRRLLGTQDVREATLAFLERRPPVFEGR